MPTHPINEPVANAPTDRMHLAVIDARGALPSASWCGCNTVCCACAEVEPNGGFFPPSMCFTEGAPSYAVTPGTPCGCFHEE